MKCFLSVVIMTGTTIAGDALPIAKSSTAPQETVASIVERNTGGKIITTYKTTKKIYYINAQKRVSKDVIESSRAKMQETLRTPVSMSEGTFDFKSPKIEGVLSLYIIDDAELPMSLVAPEGRWAFVNVAPLTKGRGEKQQFFEARFKKECARVGCMLFGGISSIYKQNLLSFVETPDDLDKFDDDTLPVDGSMRCSRYLLSLGVKPYRQVSYKKAVEEGWAPAPTNAIQQAIWDKVKAEQNAKPTKPIRILPGQKPSGR